MLPAILVSGTPSFLGGGISGSSVCGRMVSVINGLFDDCRAGPKEEKGHRCARMQCAHRVLAVGWEAKRKMVETEGLADRRVAILQEGVYWLIPYDPGYLRRWSWRVGSGGEFAKCKEKFR